jgi:CDP-glycerol glycerophosphotransferase
MPQMSRLRLRGVEERVRRAAKYERLAWLRRLPIKNDTVLYESFAGNGMLCNPEAIFRGLLAADDLGQLKHVWALRDLDLYASTIAEFADHPRVSFVRLGTAGYDAALATAKYLVNNATFPKTFGKRDGQIYLNTWHGTPLKAMGYHVPEGAVATRNVVRNLLACDYLLAPNEATASMYLDAYRIRNLYRGRMIEEGTPRIDRQFVTADQRDAIRARLRAAGVAVGDDQQIVLYAPTWKGDFYGPTNDIKQLRKRVEQLRKTIDTDKYCVLLKVHQQVYDFAMKLSDLQPTLVPNDVTANEVLAATDVLVTDYSSIFVDFLATGRPILFFAPDLDDYGTSRGLNLPQAQWPGPIARDVSTLAALFAAIGTGGDADPLVTHAEMYRAARDRFCAKEDGHAVERVIDIVFRGRSAGYHVSEGFTDGRETILMYLGGVLPNGITASALSLLDSIDHDRFDVSVFYAHTIRRDRAALIDQINPRVRLLPRTGGMLANKVEVRSLTVRNRRAGLHSHAADVVRHQDALREEWVRCFGNARFKYVVDFSGYSPLWDKILLQGGADSFAVWLHNDLRSDADRQVNGRFLHRANLRGMFDLYRYADHLVSVSPALCRINRESLTEYAEPAKFTYARNTINHRRVLQLGYGLSERELDAVRPGLPPDRIVAAAAEPDPPTEVFCPTDLRASIDRLAAHHPIDAIAEEATRRAHVHEILPTAPGTRTFVTAGRLSPEKNHARLIKAFDLVHQEHPKTRLVILGSGPLKDPLEQLVTDLGLHAAVTLAGHQPNPYSVMANADCFVMSSDYEGQPMVVLEALVLGLPVISTSFASVADAFPEGCGLVVDSSVPALAAGMKSFLRGEVEVQPFDYEAYNREATEEFYRAIGARPPLRR